MTSAADPATSPQLVWSGPESDPGGDTRRIFEGLFASAEHSLWISSFVSQSRRDVLGRVAKHLDATPGLRVNLILNLPRYKGDDRAAGKLVGQFADRFWKRWPGTTRPCVYYDPRPVRRDRGQLHAKLVVADDERVFVTSVNLTRAAWDANIELGVLLRDRALAGSLVGHLQSLIERKHLLLLPGSRTESRSKGTLVGNLIARLIRVFGK